MYERPDWVRRMNAMAGGGGGAAELVPLDADDIIERASRTTGLDDFGPPTWEEPFRKLVASLDTEANLHVVGRLMSRHDLLRHLRTRLEVIDAVRRDPSIEEQQVLAPVVVTGPARSGTSILQELLNEDPQLRSPRAWEMAHPLPASSPEQREAWTESELDLWMDVQPEFAAVHEMRAGLPEECIWLFAPEFEMAFWSTCTDTPSFTGYRVGTDPLPGYRFHRTMLQLLQHVAPEAPRTWALKSPVHLGRLPALFAVYPDARVIHTHRDPAKVLPSVVSTVASGRWLRSDAVDPKVVAGSVGFGMQMLLEMTAQHRADGLVPEGQIADLHYLDLLRDPAAAIRGAYERLGLPFAADQGDRIRAYLAARPQDKHGVHRYSAADFGLDLDTIRSDFAGYVQRYAVEQE
jgi:hypothetical protein